MNRYFYRRTHIRDLVNLLDVSEIKRWANTNGYEIHCELVENASKLYPKDMTVRNIYFCMQDEIAVLMRVQLGIELTA